MDEESIDGKADESNKSTTDILQYSIDPFCNMQYRVFKSPNQQHLATLYRQDMHFLTSNKHLPIESSNSHFSLLIRRFIELNPGSRLALIGMPTDANFMRYMAEQGLSPIRTTTDLQMTAEYMTDF
jgi:hypothetical protein